MAGAPVLSPELDLLLLCGRVSMDAAIQRHVEKLVGSGVDWDRLLDLATRHGLLPLLNSHVSATNWPIPDEHARRLRSGVDHLARRNLELCAELVGILDACASMGIEIVPLKGPVLAETVYGSLARRHYRDLDLLFDLSDWDKLFRLLQTRGYRVEHLDAALDASVLDNSHHVEADLPDRGIHVELHYSLVAARGRVRRDLGSLRARLERRMFAGRPVQVLGPEDLFVYLCEHGAAHSWTRLEWICTIAELLRRPGLDVPAIKERAGDVHARRRVDAALHLVCTLFPGEASVVPVSSWWADRATRLVLSRLRNEPARVLARPLEALEYQLLTDDSGLARLRRIWRTLLVPAPYDLTHWPPALAASPLRYAARPLGLIRRTVFNPRQRPS